jgi:hypothetical protein
MSKERELLQRCLDEFEYKGVACNELCIDINKLLAQPEQEPVAWCQLVEGKVQDLLTSFEMKDWINDESWIPLYTAPPKREPLSDEEIYEIFSKNEWNKFIELARAIEKAHGIGGGE